jgi:hypothetical protein
MQFFAGTTALFAAVVMAAASMSPHDSAPLPPGVQYAAPTDPVRIESVQFSSSVVHAGDVASARVLTTSNAAAMLARVGKYQVNMPRVDIGIFALSMRVPRLPMPAYRANITIIAIRADGETAQQTVTIKVRD